MIFVSGEADSLKQAIMPVIFFIRKHFGQISYLFIYLLLHFCDSGWWECQEGIITIIHLQKEKGKKSLNVSICSLLILVTILLASLCIGGLGYLISYSLAKDETISSTFNMYYIIGAKMFSYVYEMFHFSKVPGKNAVSLYFHLLLMVVYFIFSCPICYICWCTLFCIYLFI